MRLATVHRPQVESTTPPSGSRPASRRRVAGVVAGLRSEGRDREDAVERLHALLLRAARYECARRRRALPHLRGNDLDDIANQAADDALVSVLARLDSFRGASRFTTWAYKFALLEAAVKLRRRAWQDARSRSSPRRGACSRARVSSRTRRRSRASCWRPSSTRSPTS